MLMGEVGPLKANLTTYLTPIVALAIGWVLLGERIHPLTLIGFGIIFLRAGNPAASGGEECEPWPSVHLLRPVGVEALRTFQQQPLPRVSSLVFQFG